MKTQFLSALSLGVFMALQACSSHNPKPVNVYVTHSGKSYHSDNCYHLRRSRNIMTLEDAVNAGRQPCKHCHPPVLTRPDSL